MGAGRVATGNDATDVVVTLPNGTRWTATFCSYRYVETLRAKYATDGECLGGRYQWMANMVLVEDTSRAMTEALIQDLLACSLLDILPS